MLRFLIVLLLITEGFCIGYILMDVYKRWR